MVQMPGTVKSARALLLVVGAGNIVASLWLMMAAATLRTGAMGQLVIGLLLLAALPFGTVAAAAIVIAAKFTTGGHRVRIGAVPSAHRSSPALRSARSCTTARGGWPSQSALS
ncbi:hypothetical protein ACWD9K_17970 [Streptomyces sp. 900116325]